MPSFTLSENSSTVTLLSDMTKKDCKFIRVLATQKICMTKEEYEEYLLSLGCDIYEWDVIGRVKCKGT